ncbi:AbiV family abortive infection protein [Mesorhizobium sp. M1339]|uniref:AbiV family abortive infection protein n=1 Tax=Mesorhizobium sp. M1339 TaxID=2957086 RepID=UPI00333A4633
MSDARTAEMPAISGRGQPPELSLSELTAGMAACRANAQELLDDAALLLRAGRGARAYTLLHTSSEELAKFFMFEMAGRRVARGDALNWKRFWQRVRSHDSKISLIDVRLLHAMFLNGTEKVANDQVAAGLALLSEAGLVPRNGSLYVEAAPDGRFRKPSDIDWSIPITALNALAHELLLLAYGAGSSVNEIEDKLKEGVSRHEAAAGLRTLQLGLERARAAGMTNEETTKLIQKLSTKPKALDAF